MILPLVWIHRTQELLVVNDFLKLLFGITVQLSYQHVYHFEQLLVWNTVSSVDIVEAEEGVYSLLQISFHEMLWID
jgi:hypothetical protein